MINSSARPLVRIPQHIGFTWTGEHYLSSMLALHSVQLIETSTLHLQHVWSRCTQISSVSKDRSSYHCWLYTSS
jgi:hypothetical protein